MRIVCECTDASKLKLNTNNAMNVNLIIRNEALEAGNSLKDRFGTPFVYGAPYGYQGTIDWLKQISAVI